MKIVTADGTAEREFLQTLRQRSQETDAKVTEVVAKILKDVQENGDTALRKYTEQFDHVALEKLVIEKDEIEQAAKQADEGFLGALQRAAENIAAFHEKQKSRSFLDAKENGVILGQRVRGLHRVAVYVPGGTAAYPSSVLMNVIPAKIAGVKEVVMLTPPAKDGGANPDILAAAWVAGVDRVFLAGGAQGVAAAAYGTQTVPKVEKIVGPGNIFVATAKKLLYGTVDIDMIAGPSEILVLADDSASPKYLAADLMSQAEHDRLASAILLTTSRRIAEETVAELERQMAGLSRREMIAESLENYGGILICRNTEEMVGLGNELAPEHLEVMLENPMEYIGRLDNAGSVFLGQYAPEPLGDYYAGPNHVLPTSGTARFFSPLGVDSFVKRSSFIYYTREELEKAKGDILCIANREGLTAHANSVAVRFS